MIEGTIPMRTAVVLQETAARVGATPGHIAGVSGIDQSRLEDDKLRVPIESAWRMWELIGATGGPGAGLCASATAERGALGVWDYLLTSRPTLAESLRTVMEFRSAVTDPTVVWEVLEDGGLLTVRVGVAVESDPVFVPVEEFVLSLILRRVREATGHHIVPVRVAFTHRVTARHRDLVNEFGTTRIDFGAPFSEITFLDAGTLPTGEDPVLGEMLCSYAELMLATSRRAPDWREQLHHAIHGALETGGCGLDTVARRLAISPRTLQRRLYERNSTWRTEVEQVRRDRATNLLRETGLPIQSVAARVGYSDARALRRAFHRWTGQTPDTFRKDPLTERTA
ncbi:helix-turn-helix domain-containing protein [Nocardia seriolae]|uniref:helix-turn-helix domain-containing protein n=1 Tax=Nocardia seriolae TaxID=37332 RepID=UPI001193EDBB|nr:AraC family transcriptional regulator [Nocardia seriolae]GEM22254.1 transcriptional regulator [Nocardia seriolae NBRC 15557]